jgi:hypothetical protein
MHPKRLKILFFFWEGGYEIFLFYMDESHGKNTRGKLFFGLVCNVLWRSKKSSFHMHELGTWIKH